MKTLAVYFALNVVAAIGRFVRSDESLVASWRKYADDEDYMTVYRLAGVIELGFAAWFFYAVWR